MGREFIALFNDWAATYDQSVTGKDPQYQAVFTDYEEILDKVVSYSNGVVLEFGVGTGNLSGKLMEAGRHVIGIEPSEAMRNIAKKKFPELSVMEGDFNNFPELLHSIDTVASTYAFHHLTDSEKGEAIKGFADILPATGKVVFADTMFQSDSAKQLKIKQAVDNGFNDLAADLQTEYYPIVNDIKHLFEINNFQITCMQLNEFVWLMVAYKKVNNGNGNIHHDL